VLCHPAHRTRSSAVEHYVDIVGVTGSIPVVSTIRINGLAICSKSYANEKANETLSQALCFHPERRVAVGSWWKIRKHRRSMEPQQSPHKDPPTPSLRGWFWEPGVERVAGNAVRVSVSGPFLRAGLAWPLGRSLSLSLSLSLSPSHSFPHRRRREPVSRLWSGFVSLKPNWRVTCASTLPSFDLGVVTPVTPNSSSFRKM
jgi:hypothetical protein